MRAPFLSVTNSPGHRPGYHLLHPHVGGETMVDELEQHGTLTNGDSIGYGRGLFLGHYRGLRRFEHGGDWIGCHAAYARYAKQQTSVIVLSNLGDISPEGLNDGVAEIVLAKAFRAAKPNVYFTFRECTPSPSMRPRNS